jgi:hypothetical protein
MTEIQGNDISLADQLILERNKNASLMKSLEEEKSKRLAAEMALANLRSKQESFAIQFEAEEERLVNKVRSLFCFSISSIILLYYSSFLKLIKLKKKRTSWPSNSNKKKNT